MSVTWDCFRPCTIDEAACVSGWSRHTNSEGQQCLKSPDGKNFCHVFENERDGQTYLSLTRYAGNRAEELIKALWEAGYHPHSEYEYNEPDFKCSCVKSSSRKFLHTVTRKSDGEVVDQYYSDDPFPEIPPGCRVSVKAVTDTGATRRSCEGGAAARAFSEVDGG
jgi:hypothetical protein